MDICAGAEQLVGIIVKDYVGHVYSTHKPNVFYAYRIGQAVVFWSDPYVPPTQPSYSELLSLEEQARAIELVQWLREAG